MELQRDWWLEAIHGMFLAFGCLAALYVFAYLWFLFKSQKARFAQWFQ